MSYFGDVDIDGLTDDFTDDGVLLGVAHDNGVDGGVVRLTVGIDECTVYTHLKRHQAIGLAKALLEAERLSHWAEATPTT